MRTAVILCLSLAGAGCLSDTPLVPGDAEVMDDRLLGRWRCVAPGSDELAVMGIERKAPKAYAVELKSGDEIDKYEAYSLTRNGQRLTNVRDLDPDARAPWTLVRYTLYRPDLLHVEGMEYDAFKAHEKTLSSALRNRAVRDRLFSDLFTCVRIRESESK